MTSILCDRCGLGLVNKLSIDTGRCITCRADAMSPEAPATEPGATHHDSGKARIELIPPAVIIAMAEGMTYGAEKYEDHNYTKGMPWSKIFGSLMRHLWAFWRGQDKDPESGLSHLSHAACNIAMLIDTIARHPGHDDRPPADTLP